MTRTSGETISGAMDIAELMSAYRRAVSEPPVRQAALDAIAAACVEGAARDDIDADQYEALRGASQTYDVHAHPARFSH